LQYDQMTNSFSNNDDPNDGINYVHQNIISASEHRARSTKPVEKPKISLNSHKDFKIKN